MKDDATAIFLRRVIQISNPVMDVPPAFIVILSYYGGVIYLLCTLQESGSLKSDFELTTQRDSSLTKETNWLGMFSRHESFECEGGGGSRGIRNKA